VKATPKGAVPVREAWSVDVRAVVVLPAGALVVSADAEGQVAAYEAATGRRVWRYPFSPYPFAIAGGHVLVRGGRDEVHLVDVENGRPVGCVPHGPFDSAVLSGGILFAHRRPTWGNESRVTAVDLAGGRRLWMRVGERERTASQPEAFAVAAGSVVVGENGSVIALDAETGAERWRRAWPDVPDGDDLRPSRVGPVFVDAGRALVAVEGRVAGLDLADGRVHWEEDGAAHVVEEGRVYASVGNRYHVRQVADGTLLRKEAAGGAPKPLEQLLTRETRVACVAGPFAYLLAGWSAGEALIAVTRERGKYAWHHQPAGGANATGVAAEGGRVFYVNGRRLYSLELPAASGAP
jgi:outer membrane protein assembly factor BamB